jgi:hypothetical protein
LAAGVIMKGGTRVVGDLVIGVIGLVGGFLPPFGIAATGCSGLDHGDARRRRGRAPRFGRASLDP